MKRSHPGAVTRSRTLITLAAAVWMAVGSWTCAHEAAPVVGETTSASLASKPTAGGAGGSGGVRGGGVGGAAGSGEDPAQTFWRGRADLIQPPPPPRPTELNLPRIERWQLRNGLDVVAVPRQGLPIVSISMAVKAGGYDEAKGKNEGAADFTAAMLRKGTRKRSADQIAEAIDNVGGSLGASADLESTSINCSALAKDIPLCLDLLADLVLRPTFPDGEMPEIRDQLLAAIAARVDDPHQLASEHFDSLLFGDDNPQGWVLDEADVQAITRQTLLAFWKTFYRPNNAILAVAGNFDVHTMQAAIQRAFGEWDRLAVPARPAFEVPTPKATHVLLVDKPDLTQATLMFGHPGIRHADPDWYAATLVNYVLGGSDFSSRLMIEVRSKRGLTYGIRSSFGSPLSRGAFRISAATRNETAGDALRVTVNELRKMKAEGPSAVELAKAKGYYAGSIPFELESAAGLAHGLVTAELHGLGPDYVRQLPVRLAAVELAAARAAAETRLDPDHLAVVIVGRASALEPQLRQDGLTFDKVDYRAPIGAPPPRAGAPAQPASAPAP